MLERAAEGRVDQGEGTKNQHYYEQILNAAAQPGTEAASGGAQTFFDALKQAQGMLDASAGKPILDSRGNVVLGSDGRPQTYFSATPAQRADAYGNVFPGGSPDTQLSIIPGKESREQDLLGRLTTLNGRAVPDTTIEELLLGGGLNSAKALGAKIIKGAKDLFSEGYIVASGETLLGVSNNGAARSINLGEVGAPKNSAEAADQILSLGWPGRGGAGPASGTIGITDSTSVKALQNYRPNGGGVEFVYDPTTNTFVAGKPTRGLFDGSAHEQLAQTIGSMENPSLVGGTFQRGPNGEFFTTENSGHYGRNWNDAVRNQFSQWLSDRLGLPVFHETWNGGF